MFTGWHPQCRCYIVPITIKDKEADNLIDDKGTITNDDTKDKQIDELPNNMQKWLEDNQKRIDNAKQLPPFVEQNKDLIEPKAEEPKKPTPLEIAEERHKARTPEQIEAIKAAWEERNINNNKARILNLYDAVEQGYLPEGVKYTLPKIDDANNMADLNAANSKIKVLESAMQRHKNRTPQQEQAIIDAWAKRDGTYIDIKKVTDWQKKGQTTDATVADAITEVASKNPNLFNGGLKKVRKSKATSYLMGIEREYVNGIYNKTAGNALLISTKGNPFNPWDSTKSALNKIKRGEKLTFDEEYALESVWHEIRHAQAAGWANIKNKTDERTVAMEVVNQFCARRTYKNFVRALGGVARHVDDVIKSGYGYQDYLINFETALSYYRIDEKETFDYFKNKIIKMPYEDISNQLKRFFVSKGVDRFFASEVIDNLNEKFLDFQKCLR